MAAAGRRGQHTPPARKPDRAVRPPRGHRPSARRRGALDGLPAVAPLPGWPEGASAGADVTRPSPETSAGDEAAGGWTTFFYDFNSPYAYFAAYRVDDVLPVTPAWAPIAFAFVLSDSGRVPWSLRPGREVLMRECERRAAELGLPLCGPWAGRARTGRSPCCAAPSSPATMGACVSSRPPRSGTASVRGGICAGSTP